MTSHLEESIDKVVQGALNNPDYEAELRRSHYLALRRLSAPDAKAHPDHERWKREEQRLWWLIRIVNQRIMERRYEIVDLDDEIDDLGRFAQAVQ